jgi:acetolactate synthase II small subunit
MHRLNIQLVDLEGALLRLLGTTERRGWRAVAVSAAAESDRLDVDLTVRGSGSIELLARQLERLHEVARVQVASLALEVSA